MPVFYRGPRALITSEVIEVTPEAAQCEFRATPHPALADAVFAAQARFAVEAGRPGVQAA